MDVAVQTASTAVQDKSIEQRKEAAQRRYWELEVQMQTLPIDEVTFETIKTKVQSTTTTPKKKKKGPPVSLQQKNKVQRSIATQTVSDIEDMYKRARISRVNTILKESVQVLLYKDTTIKTTRKTRFLHTP